MREPRPTQRFPTHGKELYEALRRDGEPTIVWAMTEEDVRECAVLQDPTLVWNRYFDPMLYFWPVEHQYVLAVFWTDFDDKAMARLVKALLRDGADWVTVSRPGKKQTHAEWIRDGAPDRGRRWDNFGDADLHLKRRNTDMGTT